MPSDGLHRETWPKCTHCGTLRPLYALDEDGRCLPDNNGDRFCFRVDDSHGLVLNNGSLVHVPESRVEPIDSDMTGTPHEAEPKMEAARAHRRRKAPGKKGGKGR